MARIGSDSLENLVLPGENGLYVAFCPVAGSLPCQTGQARHRGFQMPGTALGRLSA
jgi:hypothetical protein